MKIELQDNEDGSGSFLKLYPETEKELDTLRKIWEDQNLFLMKWGCCVYGDGKTQHRIEESNFSIKIY